MHTIIRNPHNNIFHVYIYRISADRNILFHPMTFLDSYKYNTFNIYVFARNTCFFCALIY